MSLQLGVLALGIGPCRPRPGLPGDTPLVVDIRLSNAALFRLLRFAMFCAHVFQLLLVGFPPCQPSFLASAPACLLTAAWSVIISCANSDTCLFWCGLGKLARVDVDLVCGDHDPGDCDRTVRPCLAEA